MMEPLRAKIGRVNETLRPMIADSRLALHGERDFGVEMVRALSATIAEMDPIMSNAKQLRTEHPGIAKDLDEYVVQAKELRSLLEQLRVMLTMKRLSLQEDSAHIQAVSRWASTLQSTR
ncbi:MAG: hypothetical protein JSS69_12560 [Acidobacteria bacterium]|nr:hypothetical protein [Acidobacteriota bacterium]MBS1866738.1 hypothetical protein [Acidobacteriota bacterium]